MNKNETNERQSTIESMSSVKYNKNHIKGNNKNHAVDAVVRSQ